MRDSSSLKIIPYLCKKGSIVNYYDPSGEKKDFSKIKNCFFKKDIKENCKNSNLVILLTEWDEFKSIDFKKIIKNKRIKIFDLRNLYNTEEMKRVKLSITQSEDLILINFKIASTSTATPNGRLLELIAALACFPLSPKILEIISDAPLITLG